MQTTKILFVDDDERLCRLLKRYITGNGRELTCAHCAEDTHQLLQNNTYDLILLDIMLPDVDGLTLAQQIRKNYSTPIIFLTAKASIDDKVNGLEIGADDYITKPFEEKELLARIQTVLRRAKAAPEPKSEIQQATFSGWCLNMINQTLSSPEGDNVDITSTEFRLLSQLVKQSNKPIKREEILQLLSGREWSPLDRSADMAISKLRKIIEKNPRKPEIIKTIRNEGYQLTSTVDFISA